MANVSSSNGLEKRPKLRFPGFDEPWQTTLLSSVFAKNTQKNADGRITNVICNSAKQGLIPQREYFDKDIANSDNTNGYYIIEENDFVYNPRKSADAPYGPISSYKYTEAGIVSPLYLCFRAKKEINPAFFEWYFQSPAWHRYVYMSGDSGARHDRVSIKDDIFFAMPICLPSAHEQERIASFLERVDQRIEKQRALVDALKKYKRGLLSREFGQQENGDLNNRHVGKLKDYFHLSSGSTPSSTNRAFYSGNIRWVSSGELKPKYLCETSQHISSEAVSSCNLREYPANTLLIAMYGLEAAGVRGTASILSVPATISQACMAIQQTGEIDIEYLYYWYIYNGQWIGIRIAQGTKQQNLSTDTLGNLRIHAPSCGKQKKVCKLLSQIDYLIEKESQKFDLISSVKRGLLQQIFI